MHFVPLIHFHFTLRVLSVLIIIILMQASRGNSAISQQRNTKVYASNINKNIDEMTLRAKFQEFGPLRNCILKKRDNDVTFAFIEFEKEDDAANAISSLNGKVVWDRTLKVEEGKGGKKGFSHYLSDNDRDRLYGPHRNRRYEHREDSRRRYDDRDRRSRSPIRDEYKDRRRVDRSYSRDRDYRRRQDSYDRQRKYGRYRRYSRSRSYDSQDSYGSSQRNRYPKRRQSYSRERRDYRRDYQRRRSREYDIDSQDRRRRRDYGRDSRDRRGDSRDYKRNSKEPQSKASYRPNRDTREYFNNRSRDRHNNRPDNSPVRRESYNSPDRRRVQRDYDRVYERSRQKYDNRNNNRKKYSKEDQRNLNGQPSHYVPYNQNKQYGPYEPALDRRMPMNSNNYNDSQQFHRNNEMGREKYLPKQDLPQSNGYK